MPVDLADLGLAVQIGDLAGRLHALARPAWGAVDPWYDRVPGPATWDQLADAARGQGPGWGEAMAGHAGLLCDLADLAAPRGALLYSRLSREESGGYSWV